MPPISFSHARRALFLESVVSLLSSSILWRVNAVKTIMHAPIRPLLIATLALAAFLLSSAHAATAEAVGNATTVDTRQGFTITGRIVDGSSPMEPYAPLGQVSASMNGASMTTGFDGLFELKVNPAADGIFKAEKEGFMEYAVEISPAPAEGGSLDLGLIPLRPETDEPYVEWIKLGPEGLFLSRCGLEFAGRAKVNWNGHTPNSVRFFANGRLIATFSGPGPVYETTFSVDEHFTPSLRLGANTISVVATGTPEGGGSGPVTSEELRKDVHVIPVPKILDSFISPEKRKGQSPRVEFDISWPARIALFPVFGIGDVGGEVLITGNFSYHIPSGEWSVEVGWKVAGESTKYSRFKVKLGPLDKIETEIKGKWSETATKNMGIDPRRIEFSSRLALGGEHVLGSYSPLPLLGPSLRNRILRIPVLGEVLSAVSIVLRVKPQVEGTWALQLHPDLDFKDFEVMAKMAIEGAYEPKLGKRYKLDVYVGGEPSLTFGWPEILRSGRFTAYIGIDWTFRTLKGSLKYVFVDALYPPEASRALAAGVFSDGEALPAAGNAAGGWRPVERNWRARGGEVFLPGKGEPGSLDAFVRLGRGGLRGAVEAPGGIRPMRIIEDAGSPQAALPLLGNVYPDSEPALASRGNGLLLLYVRDTGAVNPVQFTEVAFSHFDGNAWSEPAAVFADARGQFAPQVVFDQGGNALAVFERMKDEGFSGGELEEFSPLLEIVWSRWDAGTRTWSEPMALTDNAVLDFGPQLAGPLANGDVVLTWNRNGANQIGGSGEPGATTNTQVLTRRWSHAGQSWGAEEVLAPNLSRELSESLAAGGGRAVYLWSMDVDGNGETGGDTELFYRVYDAAAGTWGAVTRYTDDAVADRDAQAAVDAGGKVYVVWNRDGNLVMDVDFSGEPSLVREEATGLGFADFALTVGPGGNLAVIWQETSEHGSDAHFRVYDPASGTWSLDTPLSGDADLERSFAPVWDAAGNLTLAYNNVEIVKETMSVEMEGGEVIEVENVPQPGRVDLLVAKRALVKDLGFAPDGLTAEGGNFLPGDELTLRARVRNHGNVAEEDITVAFYDGDPAEEETLIGTAVVPGWLRASDEAEVSVTWTIPQPAVARTVFAVVDPEGWVTEADEENNALSLDLNGVNLELEYVSGAVLRDGSARVVAGVKNLSAPESPVSVLRLRREGDDEVLLEKVVSQLAPGESVVIPLDLPAGTHPEGSRAYRLTVDEEELSGDVDADNNVALFSLLLWIDDDGDGIPGWWEELHGLSDSDPSDAGIDADGDGFTNRQEYLAGTDPRDASSVLRVGEIAQRALEDGGGVAVSWASAAGRRYKLERSYNLRDWTTIADEEEAAPPLNTVVDDTPPPDGRAFYRLELLETSGTGE